MRRALPYVLVILAAAGSSWLFARSAVDETATIAYWNAVDACTRGNETVRQPLHDFFVVFAADESVESDDPEVAAAAREVRKATVIQQCLDVVEKVGDADPYIPPEDR